MAWYDDIANTTKGNVQGLVNALRNTQDIVKQGALYKNKDALAALLLHGDIAPIMAKLNEKSPANPMEAVNAGLSIAPFGITAYHASPHTFENFDLSKIGTGSGTQNFSHGFYFAENPKGAEPFKAPKFGVEGTASRYLKNYETPENAISALNEKLSNDTTQLGRKHTQDAIDLINQGKATTGNMYKVDIADEAIPKMLDWHEQVPEEVRKPLSEKAMQQWGSGITGQSGRDLYNELTKNFEWSGSKNPQKDASDWLLQNGIPGVKYPDIATRGTEGNSTNYVVYDPNLIKILERK